MFDKDNSGTIDRRELSEVLLASGEDLTAEDVNHIMRMADTDGDGEVCYRRVCSCTFAINPLACCDAGGIEGMQINAEEFKRMILSQEPLNESTKSGSRVQKTGSIVSPTHRNSIHLSKRGSESVGMTV